MNIFKSNMHSITLTFVCVKCIQKILGFKFSAYMGILTL